MAVDCFRVMRFPLGPQWETWELQSFPSCISSNLVGIILENHFLLFFNQNVHRKHKLFCKSTYTSHGKQLKGYTKVYPALGLDIFVHCEIGFDTFVHCGLYFCLVQT